VTIRLRLCTFAKNSTEVAEWLLPIILAPQEVEIRRIAVQSQPGQIVARPHLKNAYHRKGWLKVKALSSSPTTAKKKKTQKCSCIL
jgi:hypothetical protein